MAPGACGERLFVYGSLRSEFDNEYTRMLKREGKSLGGATVRGAIYLIGKYPGYKAEPAGEVRGEVWEIDEPTMAALDEYEGDAYRRIEIELLSPPMRCWIFLYGGAVRPELRIESGDFLKL